MAYDAADRIDRWAREGHVPDMNERAQIRATTSFVAESVTGALDSLITAHGSGGFALKSPLQRYWRDSNVGARHAFVLPDIAFESYGKTLLGVEDAIAPIL
jgi:alkylation response protein AidB-like acyl-CoA dehydrogenase